MIWVVLHILIVGALVVDALLRPFRQPSARVAWVVVLLAVPALGAIAYLLLGRVSIGRRRTKYLNEIEQALPAVTTQPASAEEALAKVPDRYAALFRLGHSVNGFDPVDGNSGQLMADSNAAIERMIEDIDAASDLVHLSFYIWLTDNNGLKMAEALKRAAGRGVACRALADDLGSRQMIRSQHWRDMQDAGVRLGRALRMPNPLLLPLAGRLDLRNHRKILIIDNRVTYCGSQNCADPEFRVKPKFAPWVDIMIRFEGPVVSQNQRLFAADWLLATREPLENPQEVQFTPPAPLENGFPAQVIGTGPTVRYSAMPEIFAALMFAARRELVITTPYYAPDEQIQQALCSAAHRGVDTTIVFPARNDSWEIAATSRSYYGDLLESGVNIFEYKGGLLHAKTLTVDAELALIGSANMDRRSFELNYENNILFWNPALTVEVRKRQQDYIDDSRPVELAEVSAWPASRRLLNNVIATMSPLI
jgi:cardiolipin synthase